MTPVPLAWPGAGAVADDFYHKYMGDIQLMQSLGVKRFRMSIAWTRIYPQGDGDVNQKGLDFYGGLINNLLAAGIEPHVTLYHWDLPQVWRFARGCSAECFCHDSKDCKHSRLGCAVRVHSRMRRPAEELTAIL